MYLESRIAGCSEEIGALANDIAVDFVDVGPATDCEIRVL